MLESLRDAMDDLHYLNALHEGRLSPSRPLPKLPDKEIQWYIENLRTRKPEDFQLDRICADPLGFYLFNKFLRKNGAADLANFMVESATLQMDRSNNAARKLRNFVATYLLSEVTVTLKHDPPATYAPNLCRHIDHEDNKSDEVEDGENGAGQSRQHVSIKHRRDNSLMFSGSTVEKILSKLGVNEKPGTGLHVASFDNNDPANAAKDQEDTLNLKELVILDNLVFTMLNSRYYDSFAQSNEWKMYFDLSAQVSSRWYEERDFEKIRILGRGGFGVIHAVKSCTTGKLYAMKIIDKRRIKRRKAEIMCIAEREALEAIDSPFVVSLKYAFHNHAMVFLVMDLMVGGDLCFHLRLSGVFTLEQTRYYAARTLLGLSILHLHSYVYRDLKPENILLDSEGYSKITDMGLAKYIDNKARGITGVCGTRGYWAPEMLLYDSDGHKSRYSFEVDWFSLGCCIYEFLLGVSPFRTDAAKNYGEGFDHTTRAGKDHAMDLAVMEMEPDLSRISDDDCRDLLRGLLCKNPHKRLGAKGFQEIANHAFFRDIPWDTLHRVVPPFKPGRKDNVVRGSDMGGFDDDKEIVSVKLDADDQEYYSDWNYVSKRGAQEELVEFFVNSTTTTASAAAVAAQSSPPANAGCLPSLNAQPYHYQSFHLPQYPAETAHAYSHGVSRPATAGHADGKDTIMIESRTHSRGGDVRRYSSQWANMLIPRSYEYYDAEGNVHGASECCTIC